MLVKNRLAMERLRTVDAVLFDKTGTLTLGRPSRTSPPTPGTDRDALLALAAAVEADSEHPLGRTVVAAAGTAGAGGGRASGFRSVAGEGSRPSSTAPQWR